MTRIVSVPLPKRTYDIRIGDGLLTQAGHEIAPFLTRKTVRIITEENVAALHLTKLHDSLARENIHTETLVLPAGEKTKTWSYLTQCVEWLLSTKTERRDMVIAFGGGVIGDLVGFAASILQRGIRFIQIPTTLLAQVDSSVGGKTGINSPLGKNLIGAFHQPTLVLADVALLATLSKRDFLAGYGEVVKYGLLGDFDFYQWLEENGPAMLAGDTALRMQTVEHCVKMKAQIVLEDETEQGQRALLNLGHTFCHALEAATGYSDRLLHGEAVAMGCVLAFVLSGKMGLCDAQLATRIHTHLANMGAKKDLSDIPGDLPKATELAALMAQDKKVQDGRLRFILAHDIGQAFVAKDVPADLLHTTLESALESRKKNNPI